MFTYVQFLVELCTVFIHDGEIQRAEVGVEAARHATCVRGEGERPSRVVLLFVGEFVVNGEVMRARGGFRPYAECGEVEPIFEDLRRAADDVGLAGTSFGAAIGHWLSIG